MKHIFPICCLLLACTACNEDQLDTYSGDSGIYFNYKTENGGEMASDTIKVHWGLHPSSKTEQVVDLQVLLFGNTADYDRTFNVEVGFDEGDENGAEPNIDYMPLAQEYVLKANENEVIIPVTILRRHDLKDKPRRVVVKLVENENLKFLNTRYISYIISDTEFGRRPLDYQRVFYIDESFPMPIWWSYRGQPNFGDWSQTKAALICDVMGIDRNDWIDRGKLASGYLAFCGQYMYRYLQENPTLDEDGQPMTMGPNAH